MLIHVVINIFTIICILIFVYFAQFPLMHSSCENIHTKYVYAFTQRMPTCILCVKTYTHCVCFYTKNAYLHYLCKNIHTMCMFLHRECLLAFSVWKHTQHVYVFTQRMPTCILCVKTYTHCVCFYTKNAFLHSLCKNIHTRCMFLHREIFLRPILMRSSYENIHTTYVCMFSHKDYINDGLRPILTRSSYENIHTTYVCMFSHKDFINTSWRPQGRVDAIFVRKHTHNICVCFLTKNASTDSLTRWLTD